MRSDMIKVGVDKAPARGLLYATGQVKSSKDMQKPFMLFIILILVKVTLLFMKLVVQQKL